MFNDLGGNPGTSHRPDLNNANLTGLNQMNR